MPVLFLLAFTLFVVEDPAAAVWVFAGWVALKLYLAHRARYF